MGIREVITKPTMDEVWFWFPINFKYVSDIQHQTIRTIDKTINFPTKRATFWGKDINITLSPCYDGKRYIEYKWEKIPIHIDNAAKWLHSITLIQNKTRFKIVEHLLSITWWLNIDYNIEIEWADNMPTERNCIQEYFHSIQDNIVDTGEKIEYFTVKEPIKINAKNGAYIILLPAKQGEKKQR